MNLTDRQSQAVERRDGPLFVHAGPGSGKTRVLVERFVRCALDDGVAVERLLAITFTEKAAAELKGRIREQFLALGERERAREAEGAWISTIHGFCSRVLRVNALAAGIDPDYRVLDAPRAARIGLDAFDRALDDFLRHARSEDRLDLVASYTPDKLGRMVRTVYSRLRSQGQTAPQLPPLEQAPPDGASERARLERALAAAGGALAGVEGKTVATALERIEQCGAALARVPAGEPGDPDVFKRLAVTNRNAKALGTATFDELEEAHSAWLAACAARKAHADYRLLARLLDRYGRCYAEAKDRQSALDFEDLELRTRDLLASDDTLRRELAGRFDQVMVDEFQDTNRLQHELLDLIARDNLFTVGDELQSIYGFRNADVSLFAARREAAAAGGHAERLAENFRSAPELIEVVNAAFASVWEHYPPLEVPPRVASGTPVGVDLLIVDKSRPRWDDALGEGAFGDFGRDVPPWRAAEARLLARRVEELAGPGKPYRYRDLAVLLRAARDMDVYEHALAERGLPTYAVGGGGYWGQQQIGDLRAYLAALANPLDELALYNVLASPLVGASLDALVLARAAARGQSRDLWWALEEAFGQDGDGSQGLADELPNGDRGRIEGFVRRFSAERRASARISLETLVDRAVTASGYDRAVLAMPDGARRMANVRKLMRLAREWEGEAGRDLRGFIDFVDEQELLETREGEAPLEGEGLDAVRLMTIHAAKGLEFPVVCVADLGRDGREDPGALQVSKDGRAGLEVASLAGGRHSALGFDEIRAEQTRDADEEERRIFFVAMTRAERRLVLSGAIDAEKWPAYEPKGAPMEWIWHAVAPRAKLMFEREPEVVDGHVRCVLVKPETVDAVLPPPDRAPVAPPDSAPVGDRPEPPPFEPVREGRPLPVARLSYSALESYKRCGYRFYLERVVGMRRAVVEPALELAPAGGDGAQLALEPGEPEPPALSPLLRGTIVHELLERIDFGSPDVPSVDAVEQVFRAHWVAPDAADVRDVTGLIEGFLDSALARRIAAAPRVRTELPFGFELEPPGSGGQTLLLNGVVDVHAEEDGLLLVVDYKSDPLEGRDPVVVCEEKYGAQRLVYALAALRSGAPRIEVVHCFLEQPDAPVTAAFDQSDRERLEADLLELAAGIVGGSFDPSEGPNRELCHGCPGQPALCVWGPDRTMADP